MQVNPVTIPVDAVPGWVWAIVVLVFFVGFYIFKPMLDSWRDKRSTDAEKDNAVIGVRNELNEHQINALENDLNECNSENKRLRAEHDERGIELGELRGKWTAVEKYILSDPDSQDEH